LLETDASLLSIVNTSLLNSVCHLQQLNGAKTLAMSLISSFWNSFEALLQPSTLKFNPLPAAACLMDPSVGSCLLGIVLSRFITGCKVMSCTTQWQQHNYLQKLTAQFQMQRMLLLDCASIDKSQIYCREISTSHWTTT